MKRRIAGILLGIGISVTLFAGCGKSAASEAVKESVETEKAGNGEGEEDNNTREDDSKKDTASDKNTEGDIPEEEAVRTVVGILLPDDKPRTSLIDGEELQKGMEAKDFEVRLCYAEMDAEKQLKQLQSLAEEGVAAFVINPVDPYVLADKLTEINDSAESSIKVIAYNNLIMNTNRVGYYVTFDEREAGHQLGERIVKSFELDKVQDGSEPISIEFLMGSTDSLEALFYYNGILEILNPYLESGVLVCRSEEITFADVSIPDEDSRKAKVRMENLLSGYYSEDVPDIIITGFDGAVYSVQEVLTEAGIKVGEENWPWISGFGSEAEAIRDVAEGRIICNVFMDHRTLAEKCVEMFSTYIGGDSPEVENYEQYDNGVKIIGTNLCKVTLIDKDNYQMLIDNGYYTMDEVEPIETVTSAALVKEPAESVETSEVTITVTVSPTPTAAPISTPVPKQN